MEPDAKALVGDFGIAVPRGVVVERIDELQGAVSELAPPLVLKLVSRDVIHKSDVGAVRVGLQSDVDVVRAAEEILRDERLNGAVIDGFLLEEMIDADVEIVLGGMNDPSFGPILMVGAGGIFLELLDDMSLRLCPIDSDDAMEMLRELKAFSLLSGARGRRVVDLDAVVSAILKVGGVNGILHTLSDEIQELDINPLLMGPEGPVAADVRIVPLGGERNLGAKLGNDGLRASL